MLTKTQVNGITYTENGYLQNCSLEVAQNAATTGTGEYSYTEVRYGNGYKCRTAYDKTGKVIEQNAEQTTTENGETTTTKTLLLKNIYDEYGRLIKTQDYGLSVAEVVNTEYTYKTDGSLWYMTSYGAREAWYQEEVDEQGRVLEKTYELALESRAYGFEYDKNGDSIRPDNRLTAVVLPDDKKVSYTYDGLGRLTMRATKKESVVQGSSSSSGSGSGSTTTSETLFYETYAYLGTGSDMNVCASDRTTNYVSRINYYGNGYNGTALYAYDSHGNISSKLENGKTTTYVYDELNRLTNETNQALNQKMQYNYDLAGNLTSIVKRNYTTDAVEQTLTYAYDTRGRLTTVDVDDGASDPVYQINSYDNAQNPCIYRGLVLQWSRGKCLTKYGAHVYRYNASGIRIEKISLGVTHKYWVEGERIHRELWGNRAIWYYYDATGLEGFETDGTRFHYQKNLQGDIVRILDDRGDLVAQYVYDAWGNHKVCGPTGVEVVDRNFIGNINPFRYRGYYYDVETGLYYLNSRYYDPQFGRFINGDISAVNPQTLGGLSLFAYACNNSVQIAYSSSGAGGNAHSGMVSSVRGGSLGGASFNSTGRLSLLEVPWLVENATTIYGAVSSLTTGIPILSHYYKYASIINNEFQLYGISKWKTSIHLSNVSFKMGALDGVLIGANVLIDMYDSYQRGVSTEGILQGGALTAVSGVGMLYLNKGIMWATTTIGTAICPGIGTAIGFTIGLVGSIFVDIFLGGWIADWIDENIK